MMSRCPLTPAGQGGGAGPSCGLQGGEEEQSVGRLVVRPVDSLLWARARHPWLGKGVST